jgi:hypothetical protein
LFKEHVHDAVERAVERIQNATNIKNEDFMGMLQSAAQALHCDVKCVDQCANSFFTLDEKASCLEQCRCYDP